MNKLIALALLGCLVAVATATTTTTEAPEDKLDGVSDNTVEYSGKGMGGKGMGGKGKGDQVVGGGLAPSDKATSDKAMGGKAKGMGHHTYGGSDTSNQNMVHVKGGKPSKGKQSADTSAMTNYHANKQATAVVVGGCVLLAGIAAVAVKKYRASRQFDLVEPEINEKTPLVIV